MITLLYIKKIFKLIIYIILGLLVLFLTYFFYQPEVEFFNIVISNPFYGYIKNLQLWLYLVLYFSVISFVNVFILFFLSLYFNYTRERAMNLKVWYDRLFAEKLTDYLLTDKYNEKHKKAKFIKSIKRITKNHIQIESLFSVYTKIQETLTIDLSEKFKSLLKEIGVYDKQKVFLYSNKPDERIIAMKMLSYLRIKDFEDRILYYSNSKNHAIRTEAFAALIRLMDKDSNLIIFIGEKDNLSLLDINVVINAVLKNFKMYINYPALVASPRICKAIIGLMLIKCRIKKEYGHLIFLHKHLESNDNMLKQIAWDCLFDLVPEKEVAKAVLEHFDEEPDNVKHLILKRMHSIKDNRLSGILKNAIETQTLVNKIEAMKILFNNNFEEFTEYKNSKNPEVLKAFKEVSDINII